MADPSKTLMAVLAAHWTETPDPEEDRLECQCGEVFGSVAEWAWHVADAIEVGHLVVPRSDIVGTEYGWRFSELGMPEETWIAEDRDAAVGVVRSLSREQARDPIPRPPGPQLLARPQLPWSVIPLPEDGTR